MRQVHEEHMHLLPDAADHADRFAEIDLGVPRRMRQDDGKFLKTLVEEEVTLVGDRELLTQVLANLLENSIRHTGAGTAIEVKLVSTPDEVHLIVADNGPGVPAQLREKLFDRFYRPEASRTTPGSGLGLSLVKAIANLHNARISLRDNRPGLLFEFQFPKAREANT